MKKVLLVTLCFCAFSFGQQSKIDSLYHIAKSTTNDSLKVAVYNQLVWKYLFSDKNKAKQLIDTSESIAISKNQKYGYNTLLGIKGIYYDVNGISDSAKFYFNKSLTYSQKHKFVLQEKHTLNNLGMYNWNAGDFKKALHYYFESIKVNDKLPEAERGDLSANFNNIGLIYQEMHWYEKAIKFHSKALDFRKKSNNLFAQTHSYNNLGICYKELGRLEKAEHNFKKSVEISNQLNPGNEYYVAVQGLASIQYAQNNYKKALDLYLQSLNRPETIPFNPKEKIALYSSLTEIYVKLNNPQKAILYGELCLKTLKENTEFNEVEVEVYKPLAEAYYLTGNIEKGAFYNTEFYNKTIEKFKKESAEAFQELEVKYDSEKKEKEILLQQTQLTKQQNYIIISVSVVLLVVFIAYLIYSTQVNKNKQLRKEQELELALSKIETQNKLQEQRLEISRDLHDNIGSQLTFIISSIDNLKYGLSAANNKIIQKLNNISLFTKDTIYELRDTIWAMNKDKVTIEDLNSRISNFIISAKSAEQDVDFSFNSNLKKEQTIVFNSKAGMNMYRIIQEAVNNAIKHAEASKITVNVNSGEKAIQIAIKDNGKGFDLHETEFGNGIQSMQKRAEELNGTLEILNQQPGTQIKLNYNYTANDLL